ncbi:MAG TPA: TPM domain-containing protein [Beijerinckiaceae bacterium]|jgi:putative membrane protein|nr:TPM domain-containing protein [Beijerinckiaceae bacterium]
MTISAADQKRIADAIHAAEAGTSGEIVCVLARRSSDYNTVAMAWAALIALASPWPMIALTQFPVDRIFTVQIAVFFVLLAVFAWPPLRQRLVPRPVARAHAHAAAMEQFMIRGLGRKTGGKAVLIFVSLADRHARIVAGDAISPLVPQSEWQESLDALTDHMKQRRVADGFVVAIERCGAVLGRHFPRRPDDKDELPDRIYVI